MPRLPRRSQGHRPSGDRGHASKGVEAWPPKRACAASGNPACPATASIGDGLELHLGVIDDPQGRNEALSQASRDRVWNWFADDWLARFNKDAGMLAIMTRWHVDDLLGRLIERFPDIQVLRYPAIARRRNPRHQARSACAQGWRGVAASMEAAQLATPRRAAVVD